MHDPHWKTHTQASRAERTWYILWRSIRISPVSAMQELRRRNPPHHFLVRISRLCLAFPANPAFQQALWWACPSLPQASLQHSSLPLSLSIYIYIKLSLHTTLSPISLSCIPLPTYLTYIVILSKQWTSLWDNFQDPLFLSPLPLQTANSGKRGRKEWGEGQERGAGEANAESTPEDIFLTNEWGLLAALVRAVIEDQTGAIAFRSSFVKFRPSFELGKFSLE